MNVKTLITFLTVLMCTQVSAVSHDKNQTQSLQEFARTPATATSMQSFANEEDKLSYTIGVDMGQNFKRQDIQINPDFLAKGVRDSKTGARLQLSKEEMDSILRTFQQRLLAKKVDEFKVKGEQNKREGDSFLQQNKTKAGVVALSSGLQYRILTEGSGAKPMSSDTVAVEYTGKTIDGTVFDTSKTVGKPVSFRLADVIPGWIEALQLMKTGATWEVVVPPSLAYGDRGIGGPIGPNQTLIFEIRLVSVKKPS